MYEYISEFEPFQRHHARLQTIPTAKKAITIHQLRNGDYQLGTTNSEKVIQKRNLTIRFLTNLKVIFSLTEKRKSD